MKSLLTSRKFWLAVFAVVQTIVLHYFEIPKDIWVAIDALIVTVIVSIAVEDAGEKSARQYFIEDDE